MTASSLRCRSGRRRQAQVDRALWIRGEPYGNYKGRIFHGTPARNAFGGSSYGASFRNGRRRILDELGYLAIDKNGADLLFQIISQRYERGSTLITTNRVFKKWSEIFNHDTTLTAALLDRLLHHAETVTIEGKSFRMKDQIEES